MRLDGRVFQNNRKVAVSLVPTILRIFRQWNLSEQQQVTLLGLGDGQALALLSQQPEEMLLDRHFLERSSYVLGIYKVLQALLPDADIADAWLNKPNDNPLFNGTAPLQRMLSGRIDDLAAVRKHLENQL
tara:strand:- start:5671 stop:6060 length:390 start_codon:yes stop_codon:yes gene_type:complete